MDFQIKLQTDADIFLMCRAAAFSTCYFCKTSLIRPLIQRASGLLLHKSPGKKRLKSYYDMFSIIFITCGATQPPTNLFLS